MLCRRLLEKPVGEWQVLEAASGAEGLECAAAAEVDCILLDYRLPDVDGVEFLEKLRRQAGSAAAPVVMLTGQGSEEIAVSAVKGGAQDYLVKGTLTTASLERTLRAAMKQASLERELEKKRQALEAANGELRDRNEDLQRFHHVVSHELRTPLTAALEFARMLLDGLAGPLTDTHREHIRFIKEACDQMTTHVNDLLDLTRMETGALTVRPRAICLSSVVGQVLTSVSLAARRQRVRLLDQVPVNLPPILADGNRIAQVLTNLLTNAVKFTPRDGEVAVIGQHLAGSRFVAVSVRDTGRGIAPEDLERVFERSYQTCDADRENEGGLGLGLAISREIVRLHGGEIQVRSASGKGSTFTFDLPLLVGAGPVATSIAAERSKPASQ